MSLPGTLAGIGPAPSPPRCSCGLRRARRELLARVTRDSVARLGLAPGMAVWAVVKAVAFDHAGPP